MTGGSSNINGRSNCCGLSKLFWRSTGIALVFLCLLMHCGTTLSAQLQESLGPYRANGLGNPSILYYSPYYPYYNPPSTRRVIYRPDDLSATEGNFAQFVRGNRRNQNLRFTSTPRTSTISYIQVGSGWGR